MIKDPAVFEALTAGLAKMTSLQQLNLGGMMMRGDLCLTSCVSVYVGWSESPYRAGRDQAAGQLHSVVLTPPRLLACFIKASCDAHAHSRQGVALAIFGQDDTAHSLGAGVRWLVGSGRARGLGGESQALTGCGL